MKNANQQNGNQGFSIKPTKLFWAFWILGAAVLALGVFLLPVWENVNVFWKSWSSESVALMLAVMLVAYAVYLCFGVRKANPALKNGLRIVEVILVLGIAVLCLLQHLDVVGFVGPCFVVGAVVWLRGVACTVKTYIFSVQKRDGGVLAFGLIAVTLGAVLMVKRFTAPIFIWVISLALILVGLASIPYGILAKPKKK